MRMSATKHEEREQRKAYARTLYQRHGLTQQEIAAELGVTQSAVSRMLDGVNPAGIKRAHKDTAPKRKTTRRNPTAVRMEYAARLAACEREARWLEHNAQESFRAFGRGQWDQKILGHLHRAIEHLEGALDADYEPAPRRRHDRHA